jgi:hypothetical protein
MKLALALVLATGCYSSTIHLADSPARARSPAVDEAFHVSLIGVIELSSAIDLAAACPATGPASIDEHLSVLGGIVNLVLGNTIPIFSVMNPSVSCVAPGYN